MLLAAKSAHSPTRWIITCCAGPCMPYVLQEAIAAKGRRLMANEARLMGSLYPTAEVQQQRLQELEKVRQEQLAAQAAER